MMVLEINAYPYGSTGKIMSGIAKIAGKYGIDCVTASGYSNHPIVELPKNHRYVGGFFSKGCHKILSMYTGFEGIWSPIATKKLLKYIHPDIIHLHNLHGWYINIPILFRYIKNNHIPVIWTLHDCWAFTGHCPHFTMAKCDKWKTGCYDCTQYKSYPMTYIDQTKQMWKLKKKWFTGIEDLTIVTPSQWLANLVKQSFLKDYPVKVINNGIDLSVFKPFESDFKTKYHLVNKYIVLGVSDPWSKRKGMDVFIELSKLLDSSKYQIVLVGTSEKDDKKLPKNVISVHRTQNQQELAGIYSAADVFVNPTREEVYGMVNVEALACGTPVVTFDTGGSPETISATCGAIVKCDDLAAMKQTIQKVCEKHQFTRECCLRQAQTFDMYEKFKEYVGMYRGKI